MRQKLQAGLRLSHLLLRARQMLQAVTERLLGYELSVLRRFRAGCSDGSDMSVGCERLTAGSFDILGSVYIRAEYKINSSTPKRLIHPLC